MTIEPVQHPFYNEKIVSLIVKKLELDKNTLRDQFQKSQSSVGTRYVSIENLLPDELANEIFKQFPKDQRSWREMNSFREKKLTSKAFDKLPRLLGEITFAIQSEPVIKLIEEITQLPELKADPTLYAGGLSLMRFDDFLNPHIDNSHDGARKLYRRINLLYYVTPSWNLEDGGHLELWDTNVDKGVTIESRFNRLVLMETNSTSWHSVSPVTKPNSQRCCVSNYYFSPRSPLNHDYFHVTSFQGRPGQHLRRLWCGLDNFARSGIRKIVKSGIGRKDTFDAGSKKN